MTMDILLCCRPHGLLTWMQNQLNATSNRSKLPPNSNILSCIPKSINAKTQTQENVITLVGDGWQGNF